MTCNGMSSERFEVLLKTRVDCESRCRLPCGQEGAHVVEIENFHVVQADVAVVTTLRGSGPLGFRHGRMWESSVTLAPPRWFSRSTRCTPLRETIAHTTECAAPGDVEQLRVEGRFRVCEGPEEDMGTITMQVRCT